MCQNNVEYDGKCKDASVEYTLRILESRWMQELKQKQAKAFPHVDYKTITGVKGIYIVAGGGVQFDPTPPS